MGFDWEQVLDANGDEVADVYDGLVHDALTEAVIDAHQDGMGAARWGRHRPC